MHKTWIALTFLGAALSAAGQTPPGDPLDLIRQGNANRELGFYARAEGQYRQALAKLEQTAGSQAPHLIPALEGLAQVYYSEQRYHEAEECAMKSARLAKSALGADHPLLATSLNDLAAIYHAQGQYQMAEPLYERALAIREAALGPNHPFVAVTLANLADLDRVRGIYGRAALRYARAIQIQERAVGQASGLSKPNSPSPAGSAGR